MATVSQASATSAGTHPSRALRNMPYMVDATINFATATTTKGSALAASDVITALNLPAQSAVITAGYEVLSAITGDVTMSLGVTGVAAAAFVSGATLNTSSAVGAYPASASAGYTIVNGATATTLDLLIATSTTAISAGTIRVFALIVDVQDRVGPASVLRTQI